MTIKPSGEPVTPGHSQDKKELDHYLEGLFFIVLYFLSFFVVVILKALKRSKLASFNV